MFIEIIMDLDIEKTEEHGDNPGLGKDKERGPRQVLDCILAQGQV